MDNQLYNMIALGGLLMAKVALFMVIIYFCYRSKRADNSTTDSADQTDDIETVLEKIDKPPDFKTVVLRNEPPTYFEYMMNQQINPERNKDWAKDLQDKTVTAEVEEAISRSRAASVCSLDPILTARFATMGVLGGGPSGFGLAYGARRATLANIHEQAESNDQQMRRNRAMSVAPPMGTIWIGV